MKSRQHAVPARRPTRSRPAWRSTLALALAAALPGWAALYAGAACAAETAPAGSPNNAPTSAATNGTTAGTAAGTANAAASAPATPVPTPAGLASAAESVGAALASSGAGTAGTSTILSAPGNNTAASGPNTGRVVRFGNIAVFRNLIPSPMLEAQAAAEYNEIVRGAAHSKLLYADTDPHVQRVRQFVDRLVPYSLKWSDRVKDWKWEVAVIRSPDIRMYCLPGGKIVVYGGLLDRVKLNDNELGMLLGHEIAHAVREHVRERLGEQQAAQIEAGATPQLFGLADLGMFPLGIGSRLVEMHYGRDDETEADVIGSDIAARAGYDPRAALTLWDKLAVATRSERDQGFIYTHPYTPARRADITKRLADMMPLYAKAIGKPLASLPDYQGIPAVQKRKVVSAP